MKNIIYIITILSAVLLISSCRDDDKIRMPKLIEGVNMRIVVDPAKSFIDFENLGSASFEFEAYSVNKNLRSVEILGTYIDVSEGDTSAEVAVLTMSQADFVGGKARGVITPAMVASAFNIPGGVNGLGAGDLLNMRTQVTLTDGRVYNNDLDEDGNFKNTAPSIALGTNASFTTTLNTFIGCPSNIKVGTYSTLASGESTDSGADPNPIVDLPGTVTITRLTPTSYQISDATGGLYYDWYDIYGASETTPGTLTDVCGAFTIVAPGSFDEVLEGTTTIDANGVITFTWETLYGDTGTTVFTPK